jgi:hypothetical protein
MIFLSLQSPTQKMKINPILGLIALKLPNIIEPAGARNDTAENNRYDAAV